MSKTALNLEGVGAATAQHAGSKIHNCTFRRPSLVGRLFGLDHYYNKSTGTRFKSEGLKGGGLKFNFWAGSPDWANADPTNPDYEQRKLPIVKRHKLKAGKMDPAALVLAEPVDKYEANRLEGEEGIADWGMEVGDLIAEGLIRKIDQELFPAIQAVGGEGREGSRKHMMQFAYPLQNGYTKNDTVTGVKKAFVYLGIDMHEFPEAQAHNVGTDDEPFVPTEQNIFEEILMELHDRGAVVDLIMCGKPVYAYLRQILQGRIQQKPEKIMGFGGSWFQLDDGVFVVWEPGIDRLPKQEMYFGDSSTLVFAPTPEDKDDYLTFIEDWAEHPDSHLFQGYYEVCFVNECPRWWARAYNVEVPNS